MAVKFSNNGILLACGTNADVFIYAVDGVLERRLINHQGSIQNIIDIRLRRVPEIMHKVVDFRFDIHPIVVYG